MSLVECCKKVILGKMILMMDNALRWMIFLLVKRPLLLSCTSSRRAREEEEGRREVARAGYETRRREVNRFFHFLFFSGQQLGIAVSMYVASLQFRHRCCTRRFFSSSVSGFRVCVSGESFCHMHNLAAARMHFNLCS